MKCVILTAICPDGVSGTLQQLLCAPRSVWYAYMDYSEVRSSIFKSDALALLLTALFFISANVVGALMLLCALSYLMVSVVAFALHSTDRTEHLVNALYLVIIGVAICCFVVVPIVVFMIRRAQTAPSAFAQDSLLQIEAAARFVLAGKDPYVVDYLGTPLADWGLSESGLQTHSPLYHLVYTPLAFLLAVPGEAIIRPLTGWYDHRVMVLVCYLVNLVIIRRLAASPTAMRALVVVVGLNPLLLTSYTYGNVDALVFTGWLLTYMCAIQRRWTLAFLTLGLTIATKQISAVAVPYLALHWLSVERLHTPRQVLGPIVSFVVPLVLIIGPFFLWDPHAFIEDTVFFVVGGIPDSYPVSGMSLQALLPSHPSITVALSVIGWGVLVPLLALSGYLTWRTRSLRATLAFQAAFFAIAIFFGRFVNVQYVRYLLVQVALSLWIREPAGQDLL